MAVIQTSYDERLDPWAAGQIAGMGPRVVDTYRVNASAGVRFGRGVRRFADGTDQDAVSEGAVGDANSLTNFLGVAIINQSTVADSANPDRYPDNDNCLVLSQGDVVVEVSEAVAVGNPVQVVEADGRFSTGTGSATEPPVPNAVFLTAASNAGDLAVIRLGAASTRG